MRSLFAKEVISSLIWNCDSSGRASVGPRISPVFSGHFEAVEREATKRPSLVREGDGLLEVFDRAAPVAKVPPRLPSIQANFRIGGVEFNRCRELLQCPSEIPERKKSAALVVSKHRRVWVEGQRLVEILEGSREIVSMSARSPPFVPDGPILRSDGHDDLVRCRCCWFEKVLAANPNATGECEPKTEEPDQSLMTAHQLRLSQELQRTPGPR